MRPFAGVIDRPAKILDAREFRTVRRRQAADRHDAEFCAEPCRRDRSRCASIFRLSSNVAAVTRVSNTISPAQIETIGDMVGVGQDFRLRRVLLRPVPLLVQLLREGERVLHALDVAARARIAVPVPGAADAAAGLEHPRRKAEPAQAMQHVHPGKARADDDRVENRFRFERALRSSPSRGVGRHDARRLPAGRLSRTLRSATPAFSVAFFNSSFSVASHAAARCGRSVAGAANGTYADAKFLPRGTP